MNILEEAKKRRDDAIKSSRLTTDVLYPYIFQVLEELHPDDKEVFFHLQMGIRKEIFHDSIEHFSEHLANDIKKAMKFVLLNRDIPLHKNDPKPTTKEKTEE